MNITFQETIKNDSGVLIILQPTKTLEGRVQEIDQKLDGQISRILNQDSFCFKKKTYVKIPSPLHLSYREIIILGFSQEEMDSCLDFESLGAKVYQTLGNCQEHKATLIIPPLDPHQKAENPAALIANGILLKSWRFDLYHTQLKKTDRCQVKEWSIVCPDASQATLAFSLLKEETEGAFLTRHVVSEPPNVIYPETFAKKAKDLEKLGVIVEIFNEETLKKMGLNALVGVGLGSEKESHLVVMQWKGTPSEEAPIAFVGKGVTFDTGGISLKPSADMDDMKWDMAGAGTVLGLMRTLAGRKAKVNAVGVVGLVENMPSGSAQRPGDIVKSLSGQTIEILNTDAEGRLVLADALWYTQDRFKPRAMIDLATLTGAIVVSLGGEYAGLFSNDDTLADDLVDCGLKAGEKVWRLPLAKAYDKDIDSKVADVKNIGSGRGAGSITAAQFLQRFTNKTIWAHIDIAGTAWNKKDSTLYQAGATAFGVRLLNKLVARKYEQ